MRIEIHQIEGQDDRRRVFNRHADLERTEEGYIASLHYEGNFYSSAPQRTIKESLSQLIQRLQQLGFRKLRSRLNFRGKRYLAERESWTDHTDTTQNG